MSLINDALKKAQHQRGGPSSPSTAPHATPGANEKPAASGRSILPAWIMVAGGVVGGLALAAIVLIAARPRPSETPPTTIAAQGTAPASSNPGATAIPADAPRPSQPVASPAEASAEEITVSTRELRAPAAATPAPAAPVAAPETKPEPTNASLPAPRPSSRMINAIEALRVAGIRASAGDSKVLMNDRVFRVGDTVDHELGIRLTGATANSLTFTDETGAVYTRNFY